MLSIIKYILNFYVDFNIQYIKTVVKCLKLYLIFIFTGCFLRIVFRYFFVKAL